MFFFNFSSFHIFVPSIVCIPVCAVVVSAAFFRLLIHLSSLFVEMLDFSMVVIVHIFLLSYSTMSIMEVEMLNTRNTLYPCPCSPLHTNPMRHTKSWHNLIRDLFNYKITAIEHFFVRFLQTVSFLGWFFFVSFDRCVCFSSSDFFSSVFQCCTFCRSSRNGFNEFDLSFGPSPRIFSNHI